MISEDTFYTFIGIWIILGWLTFIINLKIKAPYGRHSSKHWGPLIDNKLGWIIMELPALFTCPIIFFSSQRNPHNLCYFFILLWLIHYINRTLIFPFRIKTAGKKMPLIIALFAIFFNFINGFICGYYLGYFAQYDNSWIWSMPFITGLSIFLIGLFINHQSDYILINLRSKTETGYKIPKGGLFRYVSCPNHLGEILEWLGFAMMTYSIATVAFALWTMFNLIPRALAHHRWYQNKFSNYPKSRKAIIPNIL